MKLLKIIILILLVTGGVGYGIYYIGTNIASEKVMSVVTAELENSGQLDEIKQMVNNDPELKRFLEEGVNVDKSNLPFTTKEQATRVLIKKIGFKELQTIQSNAQKGMSNNEIQVLLNELEGKLTEEEIVALKVIAYQELFN
ncbi:EF-hand domain-containing protein [Sporosarcina sp. JAI121]|uniref:EF-hand domain-containing protein n=1 Tax=Sporosarcina sp. JAI121 TaxID=2723064 RepID=UPI0015CD3AD7|nr:EF-hand domain-containing protein [Sporosarcina sp. JAI121]NYF24742.1 hypothetical protein [Sporosarcina sp. JAI121]